MWDRADAFHFVWKRMSGDMTLTADVRLLGQGTQQHRKAGWVIRQTLDPDSAYVSAVVHGDGLTSMQYRPEKGETTLEIRSPLNMPRTLRLERQGNTFTIYAAADDGKFDKAGSATVELRGPVYVGLAVCSHDVGELERAVFSRVSIENSAAVQEEEEESDVESKLEIISPDAKDRKVVYRAHRHIEAPNWSRDGKFLIFNSNGRIYKIPVEGGEPKVLNTGSANRCNNDHGLSPDGSLLAFSHSPEDDSLVYVVPMAGGKPRQVVDRGPEYWHGWSPDGKTLAYVAERHGNFDIYTVPVEGGAETRLTNAAGLDDGPDYSPDGKYIYFNSERIGAMKIWRMKPNGGAQEQVTNDGYADWFPHPSPDGKWLVFLSYDESVKGHPANKHVKLRIMPLAGGKPQVLTALFGGQGTINVPSWSPDSKRLAFVSYRLLGP
jgi:Tol biopolymer transport system component/regulation of enolase protein 1 (concanavalin A-like superfamily)